MLKPFHFFPMTSGMFKFYGWMVLPILFLLLISNYIRVDGAPQVPCYFIFGDSLADNGNNNVLNTTAKVNYAPYGIDFPSGPTGRFCNGRTIPDLLAELLGFENFIPPFATTNGTDILYGLNYASGGAGILDETGKQLGERIPFNKQLQNHKITISRLVGLIGTEELAAQYLNKCLYTVGLGSDDYINNFFMPEYYTSSQLFTLEEFTDLLIEQYTEQIRTLYEYGARKVVLFGLGELGCTPDAIETYGTDGSPCVETMNNASQLFNSRLIPVVDQLNDHFTHAQFIYINSFGIADSSAELDFKVIDIGCCSVSEEGQCIPDETTCQNRTEYAFWDSFHPTEILNIFTAQLCFNSSDPSICYPFDISHLVLFDQGIAASK